MQYEDFPWYATLLSLPGLGVSSLRRALARFGTARAVVAAGEEQLLATGMRLSQVQACRALRAPDDTRKRQADWLHANNIHLLSFGEADYPDQLRQVPAAPAVLFVQGAIPVLGRVQLAIVGSRNPTPSGRETARDFAAQAVAEGLVVTSGLALGIDSAAHQGALSEVGHTIAVMGTGPDRVYPSRNRGLARDIVASGGALLTEFLPGTAPEAANFPRRNRIISGLSAGVLVVEAALPSGSLITAQYAAEQGREVLAVPGSIYSQQSRGTNDLIGQGAALVQSFDDVLSALGRPQRQIVSSPVPPQCSMDEDQVMAVLGYETTPLGILAQRAGLSVPELLARVGQLELEGKVEVVAGGVQRSSGVLAPE